MSTNESEQYRAGFEAWFESWRVSTWHPLPFDIANGKAECPKHWNTNAKRHMEIAWQAAKREASTEPSALVKQLRITAAMLTMGERIAWGSDASLMNQAADALEGRAGALTDDAKDAACWQYIEEHATTHGGGHGFTITCFVPVDHEDMQCGILAAIETHTKEQKP